MTTGIDWHCVGKKKCHWSKCPFCSPLVITHTDYYWGKLTFWCWTFQLKQLGLFSIPKCTFLRRMYLLAWFLCNNPSWTEMLVYSGSDSNFQNFLSVYWGLLGKFQVCLQSLKGDECNWNCVYCFCDSQVCTQRQIEFL